jgi:hypothetical protein
MESSLHNGPLSNAEIADRLSALAQLSTLEKANPYKVRTYRKAAAVIRGLGESVDELVRSNEGPRDCGPTSHECSPICRFCAVRIGIRRNNNLHESIRGASSLPRSPGLFRGGSLRGILRPTYYADQGQPLGNDLLVYLENWYAAGGVISSASDLLVFSLALFGGRLPNELMATYYGQRASVGLIVS